MNAEDAIEVLRCMADLLFSRPPAKRVELGDLLADEGSRTRILEAMVGMIREAAIVASSLDNDYLRNEIFPRAIARGLQMVAYIRSESDNSF